MSKELFYKYLILSFRWYIAYAMLRYGWSKMTDGQFHVYDPKILEMPMKDVDSFYLAWHLFSRSTFFNISVGFTQCLGAILILFDRTKLIGALVLLPVLFNIFIIDVSFTTGMGGYKLPIRLFGMILCDLAILYYHKDLAIAATKNLIAKTKSDAIEKWWVYILLFVMGFLMDFIFGVLTLPIYQILEYLYPSTH
jgi:uncharacterized membrane protein YphA (DoxX/SURF4 family)